MECSPVSICIIIIIIYLSSNTFKNTKQKHTIQETVTDDRN